jgi:hypothetical protein
LCDLSEVLRDLGDLFLRERLLDLRALGLRVPKTSSMVCDVQVFANVR